MYEGSAVAFISEDHKLLLHNQAQDGKSRFGEDWGLIGGQIEKSETPIQALKRELKEELAYELPSANFFADYLSEESQLLAHVFVAPFPGFEAFSATDEGDIRQSLQLFTLKEAKTKKILEIGQKLYSDLSKKGYLK